MTLTAIDLFGGCGGTIEGLKNANFRVLSTIEIDPIAAETCKLNHPNVRVLVRDVAHLTTRAIRTLKPRSIARLDLLSACPPCQGFSRLPKRNSSCMSGDSRNLLVLEIARYARVLMPRTIMIENVRGLSDSPEYALLEQTLRRLGYVISKQLVDAADFGVPQRRVRFIVIASRLGRISFPPGAPERRTVRDAIAELELRRGRASDLHHRARRHHPKTIELIRKIPKDGGSRTDLPVEDTLRCHGRFDGFYDVYGRMAWDVQAPTLTRYCVNPSKGRFLHPDEDRSITLYEAMLLQSFPISYAFPPNAPLEVISSMIGEAFPPRMAYGIAVHLWRNMQREGCRSLSSIVDTSRSLSSVVC